MREELRIGGVRSPFSAPKNIFVKGNIATICNADSKKLSRVNLENYTVEDYHEFSETVHSYVSVDKYEFVLLDSGLYVI